MSFSRNFRERNENRSVSIRGSRCRREPARGVVRSDSTSTCPSIPGATFRSCPAPPRRVLARATPNRRAPCVNRVSPGTRAIKDLPN